jgi:hypothetical protein
MICHIDNLRAAAVQHEVSPHRAKCAAEERALRPITALREVLLHGRYQTFNLFRLDDAPLHDEVLKA